MKHDIRKGMYIAVNLCFESCAKCYSATGIQKSTNHSFGKFQLLNGYVSNDFNASHISSNTLNTFQHIYLNSEARMIKQLSLSHQIITHKILGLHGDEDSYCNLLGKWVPLILPQCYDPENHNMNITHGWHVINFTCIKKY
jgi:hypothetical protein